MVAVIEILHKTKLFETLKYSELEKLANSADVVELPAGWEIIREGDIGQHLYVVVEGNLQVFTTSQDGNIVVLSIRGPGDYVGEQALLPGERLRNASVRTFVRSTVIRIHQQDFLKVLDANSPLHDQLLQTGREQEKNKVLLQSAIFRRLQILAKEDWTSEQTYPDETVIFSQGDPGDFYYLILSGKVTLYQEIDKDWKLLAQLEAGQGFGEMALLKHTLRSATAIAKGELKVLRINGEAFRNLYLHTPELREYIQTLHKVYSLRHGFVTQHTGKFMNQDSVTTMFHLNDGRTAISSYVIGRDVFNMGFISDHEETWEKLRYHSSLTNTDREVRLDGDLIVGVTSYDLWDELGTIHNMMMKQIPVTEEQLIRFKQSGYLSDTKKLIHSDTDIVCACLNVNYGTILQAAKQGLTTLDKVSDTLGCGTVCGSCQPQIREILGENGWTPVIVTEEFEVIHNIRSFRFEPSGITLSKAKPGQHIIIKAPIDGHWVQRPYTISSSTHESGYREVTIKREPHGHFSNWLFDRRDPNLVLQISDAQGDFFVDMEESSPVVCFVAGIGMTPALSILRTSIAEKPDQTLYIDYSARTAEQFVYREDIQSMVDAHDSFDVKFRETSRTGRITQKEVSDIVARYPDARIYICGPNAYQDAIKSHLLACNVPDSHIHTEEFVPVGGTPEGNASHLFLSGRLYFVAGGLLLLAFLLQYTFHIKWEWLETVQANEGFKRWSGVGLVVFILFQWYLPVLRWRGLLKTAARQYHWHKIAGALSPAIYFLHSTSLGYAYTLVLSMIYFGNFVLGLLNQDVIPESSYKKHYTNIWLVVHVILSTSMISLILYHIFVVFAYQ